MDRQTVLIGSGALVVAAGFGYMLTRRAHRGYQGIKKSYNTKDPIIKYIIDNSLRMHPVQEKLVQMTLKHSEAIMLSSLEQMQFLSNLCRVTKAKKTIDIGVYTGHSAMMVAMALPEDGKVVAIDINDEYPELGRPYWKEAGVEHKIDLRIGKGEDIMADMVAQGESGTYDFAFLDTDKTAYDLCYEQVLKLLRSGGILAIDNTLFDGMVMDPSVNDENTTAIRALNKKLHQDSRINVSLLNVGDGTTLVFKK